MIDLNNLQKEFDIWMREKSGLNSSEQNLKFCNALGMAEEAGEVAHMVRCDFQNIREGLDKDKIKKEIGDGVVDTMVFGMNLCSIYGIDIEEEILKVCEKVLKRDWNKHPADANKIAEQE